MTPPGRIDTRYRFKGWDWTELAEAVYGRAVRAFDEEVAIHMLRADLAQSIFRVVSRTETARDRALVTVCRAFVRSLDHDAAGYQRPVWQGIAAVESDYELLRQVRAHLAEMWT